MLFDFFIMCDRRESSNLMTMLTANGQENLYNLRAKIIIYKCIKILHIKIFCARAVEDEKFLSLRLEKQIN